jgi:hypothetical protein
MRRLAIALTAGGLLTAGCGHPLIPAAEMPAPHHAPAAYAAAAGGRPVLGVNVYATHDLPMPDVRADAKRVLAYVKDTLRASAVDIVWNLYTPSDGSNEVESTADTLTAGKVAVVAKIAHEMGLQVELRPLIFVVQAHDPWEGGINPSKPASWFASYFRAELPYLRVAQALGVHEFVVATEMHRMSTSPLWTGFFKRVQSVYHGNLTYASWDADYFPPAQHLLPLPSIGMDFYEGMPKLAATASIAQVTAAWATYFSRVPRSVLERTTLQEVGIAASPKAFERPPDLNMYGAADTGLQARWFAAACNTVVRFDLRGIFFWKVDLADYPRTPTSSLSVFEGRSAARAIAQCAALFSRS